MELKQIASIINTEIVPNLFGGLPKDSEQGLFQVAEDLSNIVDVGKRLAQLDGQEALSYNKKLMIAVTKNYFDSKAYLKRTLGILRTADLYHGILQIIKAGFIEAVDSHSFNLVKGQQYNRDLIYNGVDVDAKIYDKTTTFTIWYSIPINDFSQYFMDSYGVQSLIALIEQAVQNTIDSNTYELELRTIVSLIDSSATNNTVHLVTLYNTEKGSSLTTESALHDYEFLQWCKGVKDELVSYMQVRNKKYNDGSIETFTRYEDINVLFLKKFDTAIVTHLYSNTYNRDDVEFGNYRTVDAWQNHGQALLPSFADVSNILIKNESGNVEHKNIVGVIYDYRAAAMSIIPINPRVSINGDGGFTNHYIDVMARYFTDTRNSAIVLALD